MKSFHGLAIGGPLDGESIVSSQGPYYKAFERQPRRAVDMPPEFTNSPAFGTAKVFTYEHDLFDLGTDEEPVYFWRLSTDTRRAALLRLFANYPRGLVIVRGGHAYDAR